MGKFFKCPLPYDNVRLTSKFGWRTHPVTGEKNSFHQGIDLARTPNTNVDVVASADGTVIRTGKLGTYGNVVMIQHTINGKRMDTNYAHLKDGSIVVKVGQKVKQGQKIGTMGSTGSSTAPHLHFEIHNGKWATGQPNAINGMDYISLDDWKNTNKDSEELTMSQYTELKKIIENQNAKIKELENKLSNKMDILSEREVDKSHKEAWEWSKKEGILNGKSPQDYVSREQLGTVLLRLFNKLKK